MMFYQYMGGPQPTASHLSAGAFSSNTSFSTAMNIGPATVDRYLFIACGSFRDVGNTINSLSVAGVAGTKIVTVNELPVKSVPIVTWWRVPLGTTGGSGTATLAITTKNSGECWFETYLVTGLANPTSVFASGTNYAASPCSVSINTPAGGIGLCASHTTGSTAYTFSGNGFASSGVDHTASTPSAWRYGAYSFGTPPGYGTTASRTFTAASYGTLAVAALSLS